MAIRVQTQADIVFGTLATETTVSHIRIQKAGADPAVKALATDVTVPANQQLRIPTGDLDLVFPRGELSNDFMDAMVRAYMDGETFQLDALTDATTVVSANGYSQQTYSNWAISTEAD